MVRLLLLHLFLFFLMACTQTAKHRDIDKLKKAALLQKDTLYNVSLLTLNSINNKEVRNSFEFMNAMGNCMAYKGSYDSALHYYYNAALVHPTDSILVNNIRFCNSKKLNILESHPDNDEVNSNQNGNTIQSSAKLSETDEYNLVEKLNMMNAMKRAPKEKVKSNSSEKKFW